MITIEYIERQAEIIRNALKKGKFETALDNLEQFIDKLQDKDLDKLFISLSARYSTDYKATMIGLKDTTYEQNRIIYAITDLLTETKDIAIDKIKSEKISNYSSVKYGVDIAFCIDTNISEEGLIFIKKIITEKFPYHLKERFQLKGKDVNAFRVKIIEFSKPDSISTKFFNTFNSVESSRLKYVVQNLQINKLSGNIFETLTNAGS